MRYFLVVSLCGQLTALGCGTDDSTCRPASTEAPTEGLLQSFADLPQTGCVSGLLGDLDPRGMWFVEVENGQPFGGSGPVTFAGECGEPAQTTVGRIGGASDFETTLFDDSYWFWRKRTIFDSGEYVEAYMVCAEDSGALLGHAATCFTTDAGERCREETIRLERFDRAEGEAEAEGIEIVSEYAGEGDGWPAAFAANVRVQDGIAYFVHGTDGLRIIDVSDPAAPFEIGFLEAESDFFNDVKLAEDANGKLYAMIASDARGILSIDVSDPTAPTIAATFTPSGRPQEGVHTLFLDTFEGKPAAFLVDGIGPQMGIYDITDPAAPEMIGYFRRTDQDAGFHDLYVEHGVAYVNATTDGMLIVDATRETPLVGQFDSGDYSHSNWVTTAGGRRVSVHGGEGFDAHIQIVDADPASPDYLTAIGEWQSRKEVSVHNIMAFGDRAYIAHYEDGVRILDLSDPTAPEQIAYYNSWSPEISDGSYLQGVGGIDLDLDEGLIYASDSQRGLLILRITVDD